MYEDPRHRQNVEAAIVQTLLKQVELLNAIHQHYAQPANPDPEVLKQTLSRLSEAGGAVIVHTGGDVNLQHAGRDLIGSALGRGNTVNVTEGPLEPSDWRVSLESLAE